MNSARKHANIMTTTLAALAVGVAAFSSIAQAATHKIAIQNMKFVPDSLEAKVGDTIMWTNDDIVPHTATSKNAPLKFDSGAILPGKTFKLKVKKKGEADYVCLFHPTMKAKLIVK